MEKWKGMIDQFWFVLPFAVGGFDGGGASR